MRIYVVANDRMIQNFRRFLDYYSVFMPNASLYVIPFNDQMSEVRELIKTLPNCVVVEPDPDVDWIGKRIFEDEVYRPGIPAWRYFRKLNAFLGHTDNFVFLDINVVVLANLEILFSGGEMGRQEIYFGAFSLPHRTIKDQYSRDFLSAINPGLDVGYNCGLFASQGGAFEVQFGRKIARRALRNVIGRAPEQGFLALYIGFTGLRHGLITDMMNQAATISASPPLVDNNDGFLRVSRGPEKNLIKFALKYSGQDLVAEPDIVKAFYQKTLRQARRR